MKKYEPHASSFGKISANIMAALCYLAPIIFPVPAIFFDLYIYSRERLSRLVKVSALQGTVLSIVLSFARYSIDVGRGINIVNIVLCVASVFAILQAYRWQAPRLPIIGAWAERKIDGQKTLYNGGEHVPPDARQASGENAESKASENPQEQSFTPPRQVESPVNTRREEKKERVKHAYSDANDQLPKDMRDEPPPSKDD